MTEMDGQARAMEILTETGVLLEGHFLLASGRHSDSYMQCARLFQYADKANELCTALAEQFRGDQVDVVVGPAVGAVQMAYEVSRSLCCLNYFTERGTDGKMELRRGFCLRPGMRALVVEDTITTGGTVREVIDCLRGLGGSVVAVGALVDRSGGTVDFGVPLRSVVRIDNLRSWDAAECPLCAVGSLPVKPGSRRASPSGV